jgi:endogenous inhibitor of DNA gyrase (YacG/DUF329 family)
MSQVKEIKCPVCAKWSNWTGKTDERCPHCGAQLDPAISQYAEEKRITKERIQEPSYLVIKDTDDTIVQMAKQFINWLKWTTFYGLSVIYLVIGVMIIIFGAFMML